MKFTTQTSYTTEIFDITVNLSFKPVEHIEAMSAKIGDKLILVYAVQDDILDAEDLIGDGMGVLYGLRKYDPTFLQACKVLGLDYLGCGEGLTPDKDAVLLDCYDHGGQLWSVRGEGVQDKFDTAKGAGVWVPDDCLRAHLADEEKKGLDRRNAAVGCAKQFLEQYNAIIAGDVYGAVIETYDERGGFVSCDHVWGCVGKRGVEEQMKWMFEEACEAAHVNL
jgi:hypothetical protein